MVKSHRPKGPSQRMLRVGELVRHAMSRVLARGDVMDPTIESVTITVPEVRMSPDLKIANVYIMPLGGTGADEVVGALNHHARFIRGRIAPLINLKYAPEVRFFIDDTFEEAGRIDALLRSDRVQKDLHEDDDADDQD